MCRHEFFRVCPSLSSVLFEYDFTDERCLVEETDRDLYVYLGWNSTLSEVKTERKATAASSQEFFNFFAALVVVVVVKQAADSHLAECRVFLVDSCFPFSTFFSSLCLLCVCVSGCHIFP